VAPSVHLLRSGPVESHCYLYRRKGKKSVKREGGGEDSFFLTLALADLSPYLRREKKEGLLSLSRRGEGKRTSLSSLS